MESKKNRRFSNKQTNFTQTKPTIHNVHNKKKMKLHCWLENKDLIPISAVHDVSAF
jgi:hypothetical protein